MRLALTLALLFFSSHEAGEKLIAARQWSEAAAVFEQLAHANPNDAAAHAALGLARINLGDLDGASAAYERALAIDPKNPRALFGTARVAMARHDKVKAIALLDRAQKGGVPVLQFVRNVAGYDVLSKDAEFASFLNGLRPCAPAEFRQFDFWLGEWDVFNPAGTQLGVNSITSIDDGCVILESWKDARGGSGHSFNFYETTTKRWHQFWVNSNGNAMPLSTAADGTPMPMSGGLVDGKMVLSSPPSTKTVNRWSWSKLDGGRVRQLGEQSTDGGKTWTTLFEGIYVKRTKS